MADSTHTYDGTLTPDFVDDGNGNIIPYGGGAPVGTIDYATGEISDDVVEQTAQTLRNIAAALEQAGSSLSDVVRAHYYLVDGSEFEACWPVLREAFATARPAVTMLQVPLMDAKMRIEIEVTAVIGSAEILDN